MLNKIKLSQEISKHEILKWNLTEDVEFIVSKNFEFQIGVQGIAMSILRAFEDSLGRMSLVCDFIEPENEDELLKSFFATPFGFSMARVASGIAFSGGWPASIRFKKLIATAYKNNKGEFGSGKIRSFISVDPKFPFPPSIESLFSTEEDFLFPRPSVIDILMSRVSSDMGLNDLFKSKASKPLLTFIYETYRNTLEHGIPRKGIFSERSTRAIIFEKIIIMKADIDSRDFSVELKKYLQVKCSEFDNKKRFNLMCVTVVDQGVGIQNSLPALNEGESGDERLKRAFCIGDSRKQQVMINRGFGLNSVALAAHQLGALIEVWSGDVAFVQDFSLSKDDKYPVIDLKKSEVIPAYSKLGTCISIYIPEVNNADQKSLFAV